MNRVSVIILTLLLCFSLALRGNEKEEDPQVGEMRDWKAIAVTIGAVALLAVGGYKFSKFLRKGATDDVLKSAGRHGDSASTVKNINTDSYRNDVDAAGLKLFFNEEQADDIAQWFADGLVRESIGGRFYFIDIMTVAGSKGRPDIIDRVVEINIEKDFNNLRPYSQCNARRRGREQSD